MNDRGRAWEPVVMSEPEWYWDLERNIAVPAEERGPGDRMLGPYRTKGEAENWRSTVESRNEAWDADDDEWNSWDSPGDE
jgi:hypothetical protein